MSRMAEQQLYIHGGYTSATSGRTFETINPANGNVLATVQAAGREDVDRAVKSAQQGQKIWASMTAMERSRILRRAVDILRERNDELAKLETLDTGKAYSETSTVDIVTGADVLEYYAGLIPALEGSQIDPRFEFVVFQRQTDGFRRDDMVIVIIINISVTITPRGGYDLRIVLKENIAPESNIALNPQFLKELFLLM